MIIITIVGLIAGIFTTIANIPQVIKTWRIKETKDISLLMYIFLCSGVLLWLIYGLLIKNFPLIAANALTLIITSTVLFFKIKYG